MAQIDQKADRIKEHSNRQYEADFHRRVNQEALKIRNSQGPGLQQGPRPPGGAASSFSDARAIENVSRRHEARQMRIDKIREAMINNGRTVGTGRIADNRFGSRKS